MTLDWNESVQLQYYISINFIVSVLTIYDTLLCLMDWDHYTFKIYLGLLATERGWVF